MYHARHLWGNVYFPKGEPKHREAQVIFEAHFILHQNLIPGFLTSSTGSFCLSLLDPKDREKGKENKNSKTKWKRVEDKAGEEGERAKGMKIRR